MTDVTATTAITDAGTPADLPSVTLGRVVEGSPLRPSGAYSVCCRSGQHDLSGSKVALVGAVLSGALANSVSATGGWLFRAVSGRRGQPSERDRAISAWFDSYELVSGIVDSLVVPDKISDERASAWLEGHESQAIFQELIAVRISDAPDTELTRVRENLRFSARDTFYELADPSVTDEFSDVIFDAADFQLKELVGRLEAGNPAFYALVREGASYGRIAALLQAVERHTNSLAAENAADRVREREYLSRYRSVVFSEHGFLEPPDFEQRRRVPVNDLYVAADVAMESQGGPSAQRTISVLDFGSRLDRTVLLGDPGGGKSTATNVLIHQMAGSSVSRIPFLVVLRDYAREDPPAESILSYLERRLEAHYQCPPPQGLIDRLLLTGRATVFFDGLDELVDTRRRREVSQQVENFCVMYPLAPVLVTSRRVGYVQARLDPQQFITYELAAFSREQTKEYAEKWFAQERRLGEQEPDQWASAFILESAGIPDLRSNPLMLALLCILYRGEGSLPRNRPAVYERCSTLLFETWDASRSIPINLRVRDLIEPMLRYLAHWLLIRDTASPLVTEDQLVVETSRYLQERRYEDIAEATVAAREFIDFCKGRAWVFSEVGTTSEGDPLFTFSHRTFLEFFAAAFLASTCDTPMKLARVLAPHIAREEWDMVAQLALQIKNRNTQDGGLRFYAAQLQSRRYTSADSVKNLLAFLARCLDFIDLPPSMLREVVDRCLDFYYEDTVTNVLPLGCIMAFCRDRNTVAERLLERLANSISGDKPSESLSAVRLASALTTPMNSTSVAVREWMQADVYDYWDEKGLDFSSRYRDSIVRYGRTDDSLKLISFMRGWIGVRELGRDPLGVFGFLVRSDIHVNIGNSLWIDPANLLIRGAVGHEGLFEDLLQALEGVTDLIDELGDPPWVARSDAPLMLRGPLPGPQERERSASSLTERAWTGGALLIAILSEGSLQDTAGNLGIFSPLGPYLSRRSVLTSNRAAQGLDIDLKELNVSLRYQRLFTAWANSQIDFSINDYMLLGEAKDGPTLLR